MHVVVRLFAFLRERAGTDRLALELPDDADLTTLRSAVSDACPPVAPYLKSVVTAVNQEYRSDGPLTDGDEVALIPPVSGGAPTTTPAEPDSPRAPLVQVTEAPLDVAALTAAVAAPAYGAIVVFHGVARNHHEGRAVTALTYEAFAPMAAAELATIAAELEREFAPLSLAVAHRTGPVAIGEASLVVCAAAPHRESAFAAVSACVDRIKRTVPVWKQESFADGSTAWVSAPEANPEASPATSAVRDVRAKPRRL